MRALFLCLVACSSSGRGVTDRTVESCADEADLHAVGDFSYALCELVKSCEVCEDSCDEACSYHKGSGDTGVGQYACGETAYLPGQQRDQCTDTGNR